MRIDANYNCLRIKNKLICSKSGFKLNDILKSEIHFGASFNDELCLEVCNYLG